MLICHNFTNFIHKSLYLGLSARIELSVLNSVFVFIIVHSCFQHLVYTRHFIRLKDTFRYLVRNSLLLRNLFLPLLWEGCYGKYATHKPLHKLFCPPMLIKPLFLWKNNCVSSFCQYKQFTVHLGFQEAHNQIWAFNYLLNDRLFISPPVLEFLFLHLHLFWFSVQKVCTSFCVRMTYILCSMR